MAAHDPVEALLFDLGGVVIDIDFDRVFARWAAHSGCDPAAIRGRFAQDAPYQQHERGELDAAAYFACLRRSLGIALTDEQFAEGWGEVFVGEAPGMAALLRSAASQLPLYAFTNSNAAHQAIWSRRFASLLAPFRRVFVSSELGRRKPEPEAFHSVASAIGVAPRGILFFDDSRENVEGALAAGLRALHVGSQEDVRAALHAVLARPV
jgi:putative hydrolase of the HAD superfamily